MFLVPSWFILFYWPEPALRLEQPRGEVLHHGGGIEAPLAQFLLDHRQVVAHEIQIQHGNDYCTKKGAAADGARGSASVN